MQRSRSRGHSPSKHGPTTPSTPAPRSPPRRGGWSSRAATPSGAKEEAAFMCCFTGKLTPGAQRRQVTYKQLLQQWICEVARLPNDVERMLAINHIPPAIRRANPRLTREGYLENRSTPVFLSSQAAVSADAMPQLDRASMVDVLSVFEPLDTRPHSAPASLTRDLGESWGPGMMAPDSPDLMRGGARTMASRRSDRSVRLQLNAKRPGIKNPYLGMSVPGSGISWRCDPAAGTGGGAGRGVRGLGTGGALAQVFQKAASARRAATEDGLGGEYMAYEATARVDGRSKLEGYGMQDGDEALSNGARPGRPKVETSLFRGSRDGLLAEVSRSPLGSASGRRPGDLSGAPGPSAAFAPSSARSLPVDPVAFQEIRVPSSIHTATSWLLGNPDAALAHSASLMPSGGYSGGLGSVVPGGDQYRVAPAPPDWFLVEMPPPPGYTPPAGHLFGGTTYSDLMRHSATVSGLGSMLGSLGDGPGALSGPGTVCEMYQAAAQDNVVRTSKALECKLAASSHSVPSGSGAAPSWFPDVSYYEGTSLGPSPVPVPSTPPYTLAAGAGTAGTSGTGPKVEIPEWMVC